MLRVTQNYHVLMQLVLMLSTACSASAAPEFLWSNDKGMITAEQCRDELRDEVPFGVSQFYSSWRNAQPYETLRSKDGNPQYYLSNGSLVRKVGPLESDRFQIEVIGNSKNEGQEITRYTAQRNWGSVYAPDPISAQSLFLYHMSVKPLSDYILQVHSSEPTDIIPDRPKTTAGSYWLVAMEEEKYRVSVCLNGEGKSTEYIVFKVFSEDGDIRTPLALVGVSNDETKIFADMTGHEWDDDFIDEETKALTEEEFREKAKSTQISRLLKLWMEESRVNIQKEQELNQLKEKEKDSLAAQESLTESKEEDAKTEAEYQVLLEEEGQSEAEAQSENQEPVEFIASDYSHVACLESGELRVRDSSLENTIFFLNQFEIIKPAQGWDETEQVKEIDGKSYTFKQVQFVERRGAMGWIAAEFVSLRSQCKPYQDALEAKEQIVCTTNGDLNVRNEALDEVIFKAVQFENVALREDAKQAAKKMSAGDQEYTMVPVYFTDQQKEGWISRDFISTREKCDGYDESKDPGLNSGLHEVGGDEINDWLFPLKDRPTHSYRVRPRGYGDPRAKGRLHAGADLYRNLEDPVYSTARGKILRKAEFYSDTWVVEVEHPGGYVVRYGEVSPRLVNGIGPGSRIEAGQHIANVGKMSCCRPMLHFELYSGKKGGELTVRENRPFQRRSDLMNPTDFLRKWERKRFGQSY